MSTAKRVGRFAVAVALLTAVASTACATTYVVQPDGLGDYATIQAAVLAVTDGDIIELADGTFTGDGNRDISVPSRPITIRSQSDDYLLCMIDCEGSARAEHRGFRFDTLVGTGDVTLQGVAIINGYTTTGGAGIWVEGASPTITNCAVAWCTVEGGFQYGGGLYVSDGGDPMVTWSLFSQNTADYGGGVAVRIASGTFSYCSVTDNEAGSTAGGIYLSPDDVTTVAYTDIVSNSSRRAGGVRVSGGTTYLQYCDISRNDATADHSGGVWLQGGFLNFCTILENSSVGDGGGVYCHAGTGGLNGCLIAFTEAGGGVGASDAGDAPSLDCCDVYGNAGGNYDANVGDQTGMDNNFSLDPELCDINNADYRLFDTSPCLAVVSPCGNTVGRYGEGCDSPVEATSWGVLKAMWR